MFRKNREQTGDKSPEIDLNQTYTSNIASLIEKLTEISTVKNKIQKLYEEQMPFKEFLKTIDYSIDSGDHAPEIAYTALRVHFLDREIGLMRKAKADLMDIHLFGMPDYNFRNKKAIVTCREDTEISIGTSVLNKYGQRDGQSIYHKSVRGKINSIRFDEYGGGIEVSDRFSPNTIYSAYPLVSEINGKYVQNIDIQVID